MTNRLEKLQRSVVQPAGIMGGSLETTRTSRQYGTEDFRGALNWLLLCREVSSEFSSRGSSFSRSAHLIVLPPLLHSSCFAGHSVTCVLLVRISSPYINYSTSSTLTTSHTTSFLCATPNFTP